MLESLFINGNKERLDLTVEFIVLHLQMPGNVP